MNAQVLNRTNVMSTLNVLTQKDHTTAAVLVAIEAMGETVQVKIFVLVALVRCQERVV